VDDVVQEVFAAAAAGLPTFRHDRPGDTFRGWLRGIARNQIALYFRHNRDRPRAAGGSDAWLQLQDLADPLAGLEEDEPGEVNQLYLRALDQVRAAFEERTWQAFWLTAIEGRCPAALAGELGMTPAAIRQARCRVLRQLKKELGDLLG
jgi:RNA polymerase sigma-70 factor (ECF subfamily)